MVEDNNGSASHEMYCIRKVMRKHTLQINATREKNNNFRIPQLGVKLHYFAHLTFLNNEQDLVATINSTRNSDWHFFYRIMHILFACVQRVGGIAARCTGMERNGTTIIRIQGKI